VSRSHDHRDPTPSTRPWTALWPLLAVALAGCGSDERPSLIQEAEEQREAETRDDGYVKREGLHIDMPYLSGKRYDILPAELVADQLGEEVERRTLGHWEATEIDFGDKQVRLIDGEIYYLSYSFDAPMDLTTALGVSGFPLRVPAALEATLECRLIHHWGLRQISLMRTGADADTFQEIRVWKYRPQEVQATP
jgi:hypothetical protein